MQIGSNFAIQLGEMMMTERNGYAVTVGFFDGVHTGHRFLAEHLKKVAAERGLMSRIVTFEEHPRQVIQSDYRPMLLSEPQDKIRRLQETGVDLCTQLHFTKEMAGMDARSFMEQFLRDRLGARCLLMGHDHRFGHDCITDFGTYRKLGEQIGIEVVRSEAMKIGDLPVSSSRIRHCLAEGDVSSAAELLGYPYAVTGTVIHGMQNGRRMGFPTANLDLRCKLLQIPKGGVYAAWATVQGETFKSMLNIGFRPTIGDNSTTRTIEAHLLDFDRDIYGEELTLRFVRFIRAEHRFDSLDSLAVQLQSDRMTVSNVL